MISLHERHDSQQTATNNDEKQQENHHDLKPSIYDLPLITKYLHRVDFLKHVPFLPPYVSTYGNCTKSKNNCCKRCCNNC